MKTISIAALLLGGTALPAQADSWTPSTRLSGPSFGVSPSVAIDAAGDAVTIWSQRTTCTGNIACIIVQSRARPAGGAWGPVQPVSTNAPFQNTGQTWLKMTEKGAATAFWLSDSGLNTADKPLGGALTKPVLLAKGVTYNSTIAVSQDRSGDVAVLVDGTVILRRGDGIWRSPVRYAPASAAHVSPDDVAISQNGDVVVSWESFDVRCVKDECSPLNYVLHATRLPQGSSVWKDSGPLSAKAASSHGGLLAIDEQGHAGLSTQVDSPNVVRVQPAGGKWSSPTPIPLTYGRVDAFASDAAGDATLIVNFGGKIVAFSDQLATGKLTGQGPLSGHEDTQGRALLAVSPSGSASVIWSYGDPNFTARTIAAVSRPSATADWTSPVDISPTAVDSGTADAVAAAGIGQSVAGWTDYAGNTAISRINANVHRP